MILKDTLRSVARSQRGELALFDAGVKREAAGEIDMDVPFVTVLSGIRRCGKSTLLRQLMGRTDGFHYFNFEDPRVSGFSVGDFGRLEEVLAEEYGEQTHYFFDEVQNVPRWELFVRAATERGKKCIITGSNASLLSRELGTRLTGRHLRHELFPFSYGEFLALTGGKPGKESFSDYFRRGGFPEFLKVGKSGILQELLNDIIARDIAVRHGIRSTGILRDMALYLMSSAGKPFSHNSLKKTFGLGSVNSALSFTSYFEDSYLLFTVPRFDYSLKRQRVSPKKAYSIDNGMSLANTASFTEDKGRMLENLVFLNLRKMHGERGVFYYQGERECDFVLKKGASVTQAVQVCFDLNDGSSEREISGLLEAMGKFRLESGLIITHGQEDEIESGGRKIRVLPAWKWLLSGKPGGSKS